MSLYELAILGEATPQERDRITQTIAEMVSDFGLKIGDDVLIHDASSVGARDLRAAFAAAYFGGDPAKDLKAVEALVAASVPIIPTVGSKGSFFSNIPQVIQASNGLRRRDDDPAMTDLAAALLEVVGLLRKQRRVFVSYRRTESRTVAIQLHDTLSERGFDVFLDTHDIRPGEPFQEVLFHRLCDSDVVIMLDTPTYFESKWTTQELGRARAKEIHILRVVWPEHAPSRFTALAETVYLDSTDLSGPEGPIVSSAFDNIVVGVERLRSKSIASRYMSITGKLRADVERIGASISGIGSHRAVSIVLEDKRQVWAYPIVGIPTAELLNDVAEKARRANYKDVAILVYDHVGISNAWADHLKWLDDNIDVVRAIKSAEASWVLAVWEPKS
ncbi:toll/interleukin-1 receptor domain-containing protein [Pseudorhodoplanes sp.]|uniref:toll/interleukin-1 receptor domain-containing protein n=1 Tax=Pseudorhodoplanes sp. TaxID=1934341 RepID=UPI003D0DFB7D